MAIYRRINDRLELIEYKRVGEIVQIQLAVNGVLAPMIDDTPETRERFKDDYSYFCHMGWQSETLIHLFGDDRYGISEDEKLRREHEFVPV